MQGSGTAKVVNNPNEALHHSNEQERIGYEKVEVSERSL
jgi:hypothetical protein